MSAVTGPPPPPGSATSRDARPAGEPQREGAQTSLGERGRIGCSGRTRKARGVEGQIRKTAEERLPNPSVAPTQPPHLQGNELRPRNEDEDGEMAQRRPDPGHDLRSKGWQQHRPRQRMPSAGRRVRGPRLVSDTDRSPGAPGWSSGISDLGL